MQQNMRHIFINRPTNLQRQCFGGAWLATRKARVLTRRALYVKAIGFDFGDDDGRSSRAAPTKRSSKINSLGTLAASLLVYGHVVKGAVGEAYLQALAVTQKYQASNKEILSAYARFYNLLLASGHDSWQDYILDQVLLGRDNAFARAAAQGTLDDDAAVLRAVAYDLDVLQELALPLPQVAELIADAAPIGGTYWLEAASSVSIKSKKKVAAAANTSASETPVAAIDPHSRSLYIGRPPMEAELAAWKAAISGKEAWSEAVQLLRQYYHLHGFGITSRNSTLRWTKGAFEEGADGSTAASLAPLPALEPQRATLDANTLRHCEGATAHHVLVAGPSGSGKSALLWDYTLAAGQDKGLRLVDVGSAEVGNILEAARGCGRYPRLRFILVADHVDLPMRGAADLMSGLAGSGPSGWPSNTLLYMGASSTSAISYDPVVSRFGLILTTTELSEQDFSDTLRRVAGEDAKLLSDDDVAYAAEWARKQTGILSVRSAVHYVRRARSG
ncbi:hypothetical protein Vretimale_4412 [Volvox reticuliferus]|uniref:AAA+ ATPase domain-containing protein n=1 Tax=Volvox reticuliferus TaxID=1737510 RepID=A0A8J4C6S3_9CHLO|nr:hypothetical protein Vretifemale_3011 [Volvox reticuliferus]GIL99186.1 hypothetical protein Vretimale_4412 [Volvox reticuliferus]